MSDSRKKYEEITEGQSYAGIGNFTQTTTMDEFPLPDEILDEYFEKNNETLMRDLVEEIGNWNEAWYNYYDRGGNKPINADQLSKELSQKYKIQQK